MVKITLTFLWLSSAPMRVRHC